MADSKPWSRRQFLSHTAAFGAIASAPSVFMPQENKPGPQSPARQWFSKPDDHYASGKNTAVTSTSKEASRSALWALDKVGMPLTPT